jgi:hypothetical protein
MNNYSNFYPKKFSLSSQKYGLGIRDPEKTYFSGSWIKGSKKHRILDQDNTVKRDCATRWAFLLKVKSDKYFLNKRKLFLNFCDALLKAKL